MAAQEAPESFPLSTVILTDEEALECQEFIRSLVESDEGSWVVKEEFAEEFQRSLVAHYLIGRAERILADAGGDLIGSMLHVPTFGSGNLDKEKANEACTTAAKACAIYPLSINCYDFGCILLQVGKLDEAKIAFAQFLQQVEADLADQRRQIRLKQRDITNAMKYSRAIVNATA